MIIEVAVCTVVSVSTAVDGGVYVSVIVSECVVSVICVVVLTVVSVSVLCVEMVDAMTEADGDEAVTVTVAN